jgi:hypothetical protein
MLSKPTESAPVPSPTIAANVMNDNLSAKRKIPGTPTDLHHPPKIPRIISQILGDEGWLGLLLELELLELELLELLELLLLLFELEGERLAD